MSELNKNDKVRIISKNNFWNNKIGIIISDVTEENLDNITVKVFLDENNNKYIIETFSEDNLELESKNENLAEKLNFKSEEDFKNYFIGKDCKFLGLDYNNLYAKHEQDDGEYTFNDEDLSEINYYESLRKIPCVISDCVLTNIDDDFSDIEDSFNSSYWDLEFENDEFLSGISGDRIKVLDLDLSSLNENLEDKKEEDYIRNYVYAETFNNEEVPSWFFVDKIANAENKTSKEIIKFAKEHKYKVYAIRSLNFNKKVIAAPKCTPQMVEDEYADYLLGESEVVEVE